MRQMARDVNVASGFQPGSGCSQKVQAGHWPWLVAGHSPAVLKQEFAISNLPSYPEDLAALVSAPITSSFVSPLLFSRYRK